MKTAAIYDPYLDTLGGGERYCLTVAEILLMHGYKVDIFWSGDQDLVSKAQQRFSLDLKGLNIVPDIFEIAPKKVDLLESKTDLLKILKNNHRHLAKPVEKINKFLLKLKNSAKYDLIFYLSDGSYPFLFGRTNFLHIQVPFTSKYSTPSLSDRFKMLKFQKIICNSKFTARFTPEMFHEKVVVLYPPVDVSKFESADKKENIILSVGRFDNILNAKKQDVLIEAFAGLYSKNPNLKWKLVLAGGSIENPENNSYIRCLKELSQDLPIEFVVNPNFEQLKQLYSVSKIYWHAAGFGVDENVFPQNTEHFGMTVVEAMASGLVPVVIAKGGIPEIVQHGENGYLWNTIDELADYTLNLTNDPEKIKSLSNGAMSTSIRFSKENFEERFLELIK